MNDISAIIVVKGNPLHVSETLVSIQNFVKEIIIANIGIDDLLVSKLSKNKKITIIPIKKEVLYVERIREELKQYASGKYLLFLDPDEVLTEPLKKQLQTVYKDHSYVLIPRKNIIFKKWIQHSRWWPDYQVRLFKKDSVTWPTIIHRQPVVKGNGYTIEPEEQYAIQHYNYESIDEYFEKAIRYAKVEAYSLPSFSLAESLKKGLSEFISRYFADEGYKDGIHGFVLAFLQMFYYLLVYVYFWENQKYQDVDEKTIQKTIQKYFSDSLYAINHWQNKMNLHSYGEKIKRKIVNRLLK